MFLLEPLFATLLVIMLAGSAWMVHSFIFAWHGFHDATKPYDVIASNNSRRHYAHHRDPGTHLYSENIVTIFENDVKDDQFDFPIHQSFDASVVIAKHWLLIQCLLWQRKYSMIRNLIRSDHLSDDELHLLVTGMQLRKRHPMIEKIDLAISKLVGGTLEKGLLLLASRHHKAFFA